MSLQVLSFPTVSPQPIPGENDTRERLAALWALRLVLDTRQGRKLLGSVHQADDLLAVVGPWVDWPRSLKQRFVPHVILSPEEYVRAQIESAFRSASNDDDPVSEPAPPDPDTIDWQTVDWSELASPFCEAYRADPGPIFSIFRTAKRGLERQPPDPADPLIRNTELLSELLGLSGVETRLLQLIGLAGENLHLRQLLGHVSCSGMGQTSAVLGTVLRARPEEVFAALCRNGRLRRMGLIEPHGQINDLDDILRLDNPIREIIVHPHGSADELMRCFLQESGPGTLVAADYPHLSAQREDLVALLRGALRQRRPGVNVLLYGPPGTGKTEFARLLAAEAGARLFAVTAGDEDGDAVDTGRRMLGFRLAQAFLEEAGNTLILFDEVEDVLGAGGFDVLSHLLGRSRAPDARKAWLNQKLEANPVPTLWIANCIDWFDRSYLRRFLYSVEFRVPPRAVRRRIVGRHLEGVEVGDSCLDRLAGYETVSPAQFRNVAELVRLTQPGTPAETEALVTRALAASMAALGPPESGPVRDTVTGYSLDYLNVESRFPVERILAAAERTGRMSLCLFGPPGTGKTQLAHHLAERVGRPLLVKRASDLLSQWVGGSERNVAKMFREARDEGAVLLLDEVDSLLRDRTGAIRIWEVTQVNELLQQMEAFDGIFVCATNRFEDLDEAALRRFTFKIRFHCLNAAQRWRLFLQETGIGEKDASPELRRRLERLDRLTPGDFAAVKRQFLALGEAPEPEGFLERLEEEIRLKGVHDRSRPIGFVR
jgi:SpoVK/Ycf46/Vps4 family AAA+-type ATPase